MEILFLASKIVYNRYTESKNYFMELYFYVLNMWNIM